MENDLLGVGGAAAIASLLGMVWIFFFIIFGGSNKTPARVFISDTRRMSSENGSYRWDNAGSTDVIIVGAGVAGAALAYTLAKDGRKIHVIERDLLEPDRIVGELLQPGGYLKLMELGLEDCVKEIDAQRVFGYALYKNGKNTKIAYPLENFDPDVSGRSFHNGRFVQRLRKKAAALSK